MGVIKRRQLGSLPDVPPANPHEYDEQQPEDAFEYDGPQPFDEHDDHDSTMRPVDVNLHVPPPRRRKGAGAVAQAVPFVPASSSDAEPRNDEVFPHEARACREAALDYASRGWHVVLLRGNTKIPRTTHGLHDSTNDSATINGWYDNYPNDNVGIRTGSISGIVVVDVDVKNGAKGAESLAALEAKHGAFDTLQAATPSGGKHIFFRAPANVAIKNSVNILPGFDVRGEAGYVAAESSAVDGKRYSWINPGTPIADMPEWLIDVLTKKADAKIDGAKPTPPPTLAIALRGVGAGSRNDTIFRAACEMRRGGYSYAAALAIILTIASKCDPPLDEEEATRCTNNAWGYSDSYALTDAGNAERFLARHGGVVRFVVECAMWIVWAAGRWNRGAVDALHRLAKETVRSIADDAKNTNDDDVKKAIHLFAKRSESLSRLNALTELASREADLRTPQAALDADPLMLGVENGVVDLRCNGFREARPEDFVTRHTAAPFDATAGCPKWLAFLDRIMDGNAAMVAYLQRIAGYCLTGLASERVIFFFHGAGANGKSTFLEVMRFLMGGYAAQTPAETLMAAKGRGGAIRNDIARLAGTRLVTASETEEGHRLAEAMVKSLTGNDTIAARYLYSEFFEYAPSFKILMATNMRPEVRGTDQAIWDRIHMVTFPVSIPLDERDKNLRDDLLAERAGILQWALAGCAAWQRDGLRPPDEVKAATAEFRSEQDLIDQWLEERCILDISARTLSTALYKDFRSWLESQGEDKISHRWFGERIKAKGFERIKSSFFFYLGIELLPKDGDI